MKKLKLPSQAEKLKKDMKIHPNRYNALPSREKKQIADGKVDVNGKTLQQLHEKERGL